MAEILLFHHAGGLTPGVHQFADSLRAAGHVVHTPDLFEGRTFADVEDGVAFAQSQGQAALAERAAAAVADLPSDVVYAGMSLGCALAAQQVLTRDGARGAVFLYGAIAPSWWDARWPAGVSAQAHLTENDPWREVEAEEEFLAGVPDGELFVYEGSGHLFVDPDHRDYDPQAAALATERILRFLADLS